MAFTERNSILHADEIPLPDLAARFGTPAYIYSANGIRDRARQLQAAFTNALPADSQPLIAFACKACSNLAILKLMSTLGLGADVVSGGEMVRALRAGIPAQRVVYSGVGKSESEILAAAEADILRINVESAPELHRIGEIGRRLNRALPVALRFNPDVDAHTHAKITTGKEENKFGLPWTEVEKLYVEAAAHPFIDMQGLSLHIGSQLTDLEPFRQSFEKLAELVRTLRGRGLKVRSLDLGGGLGIVYRQEQAPCLDSYARLVRDIIHPLQTSLVLEPGRLLVGESGLLLAGVETIKLAGGRRYIVLDAGMNDLIRPTLYDAWHPIRPVRHDPHVSVSPADIVGPVCETGDTFALDRPMPPLQEGDLVAIMAAGAYGFSMASTYNTRPLPPEILVDGGRAAIIRQRQSIEDILEKEAVPDWLS